MLSCQKNFLEQLLLVASLSSTTSPELEMTKANVARFGVRKFEILTVIVSLYYLELLEMLYLVIFFIPCLWLYLKILIDVMHFTILCIVVSHAHNSNTTPIKILTNSYSKYMHVYVLYHTCFGLSFQENTMTILAFLKLGWCYGVNCLGQWQMSRGMYVTFKLRN